jgi:hypothetical protein
MNWKKLLESVSESVNDHLRLCNAYLLAENRILRHHINGRVQLTDSERKELAKIGANLGKKTLEEIARLPSPAPSSPGTARSPTRRWMPPSGANLWGVPALTKRSKT